jgi:membrane peptidoglycan carboxypeptidase
MKPLSSQPPRLATPKLRPALLTIHGDLFTIELYIQKSLVYSSDVLTLLEKLTLVLEDRRFFQHQGIDLRSCVREVFRAITFRRHGGASTIDMQLVRTATGYRERTVRRKLYEMLLAWLLQFRYSKIVILRSYLACAFFGSHLTGADKAARKLFNRSANDLSLDEAAVVAAMLVYPRPRVPTASWTSKVDRRAKYGKRIYVSNKQRFDQLPG